MTISTARPAFAACAALLLLSACGNHNVTTRSAGASAESAGGTIIAATGTKFYGRLERPMVRRRAGTATRFRSTKRTPAARHCAAPSSTATSRVCRPQARCATPR